MLRTGSSWGRNLSCSGIEVVITGLTRNQFGSNPTRVRIPPAAPNRSKRSLLAPIFCAQKKPASGRDFFNRPRKRLLVESS